MLTASHTFTRQKFAPVGNYNSEPQTPTETRKHTPFLHVIFRRKRNYNAKTQ
jgi:hypothetical protein